MDVVHRTCAGMDVHKKSVPVCLVWRDQEGQRHQEVRTFSTMTPDLLGMRGWLEAHECRVMAMESTGVYWKPLFNLLEAEFEVLLVNPTHIKQVPGRKTDVKESEWIAQLLEHGLLKGSFLPEEAIREIRDLTRYRRKLVLEHTAEVNRVQQVLEDANLKLASVATDVMGASGRAILRALVAGERDPEVLAEMAKGRLRNKKEELVRALQGRLREHHARLLSRMGAHLEFLEESIAECDAEIEELCRPFQAALDRLDGVPGMNQRAAQDRVGESGVDMGAFPSHKHLCAWAAMCPGQNDSGPKRGRGTTRQGNRWLQAMLVECAHAAGRTKDT